MPVAMAQEQVVGMETAPCAAPTSACALASPTSFAPVLGAPAACLVLWGLGGRWSGSPISRRAHASHYPHHPLKSFYSRSDSFSLSSLITVTSLTRLMNVLSLLTLFLGLSFRESACKSEFHFVCTYTHIHTHTVVFSEGVRFSSVEVCYFLCALVCLPVASRFTNLSSMFSFILFTFLFISFHLLAGKPDSLPCQKQHSCSWQASQLTLLPC